MPITDTLKTAAVSEDLKSFISRELKELRLEMDRKFNDIRGELDRKLNELRIEFHSSLRDQTFKLMAMFIGAISLFVAVIKLIPNAH